MAKQHTLITLYYAIMTNTEVLVESYLESGEDPSVDLSPAVPTLNNILELETDDELGMLDRHILLAHHSFSRSSSVSPLHVAVVQCYKTALNSETRRSAMNILKTLLEAGAKTSIKATCNLVVCHKSWLSLTKGTIAPMIPCALAEFLKEDNFNQEDGRLRRHTLDEVIQLLQAASSKTYFAYSTPPSVTLPLSVSKTWKTLLFSEKFSDVKFKCQDGTTFHAHRNILAAASPYFSTAFEGPWGKQDENGLWETSNPPCVMEAALSFIYTGEVPPGHLDEQPEVMLAVSSEYDLTELRALSEASYARSLDSDNVKRMLQISHLYGSSALKRSCFDFVVKNMAKVLRNPSMASLATEDAELWVELAAVLFPTTPFPEEQVATSVRPAYMESQPDINERMRSILVDWLVSLQFKYRFVPETLHLAINLIDRFLQLKETSRANLQSVGITSLLIAVKYKEIIYPIDLGDLVYLCSGDYTPQDVSSVECLLFSCFPVYFSNHPTLLVTQHRSFRWKRTFSRLWSTRSAPPAPTPSLCIS
jgi:hypothetical protein